MANLYLAVRDGGKTNEEGAMRLLGKLAGGQNVGRIGSGDFGVAQHGTPNMSVDIATGDIIIPYTSYIYHCWSTALQTVTIAVADATNPRISRVVAYVDLSVVASTNPNNPDAIKLKEVAGSAAGSPTRPNDAAVQASVGSGNPFTDLGDVRVEAMVTTIVNAKITDTRSLFVLGGGIGGIQFPSIGTQYVQTAICLSWVAPGPGTFTKVYARARTAPTGADLIYSIKKNGVQVTTVTIAAGSQTGNTTGLSITFSANDYFDIDCTQIGSTVPGADVKVSVG